MRAALLVGLMLAACGAAGDDAAGCEDACGAGLECTRAGACLPPSEIRAVHVTWTVYAHPAGDDTCTTAPQLWVKAVSSATSAAIGFAPVPCSEGAFTIDKLDLGYDNVEIGIDGGGELDGQPVLADGTASFDLHL